MNSYNHYAYGAVCQWLFESVAGFRPDPGLPGFRHVIFEPVIVPALSPVAATHDSAAGHLAARWSLEDDRVTYDIELPEGASGTLVLDTRYTDAVLDGAPLAWAAGNEKARNLLAPGAHRITFRISR
jgi:alpha-L-rhamnosidase